MVGKLLDPKPRQTELLGLGDPFVFGHIGEMQRRLASTGMVLGKHVTDQDTGLRSFRYFPDMLNLLSCNHILHHMHPE